MRTLSTLATLFLGLFSTAALVVTANEAERRADAMLEAGDLDGYGVWKRILWTVGELQGTEPASGVRVH